MMFPLKLKKQTQKVGELLTIVGYHWPITAIHRFEGGSWGRATSSSAVVIFRFLPTTQESNMNPHALFGAKYIYAEWYLFLNANNIVRGLCCNFSEDFKSRDQRVENLLDDVRFDILHLGHRPGAVFYILTGSSRSSRASNSHLQDISNPVGCALCPRLT